MAAQGSSPLALRVKSKKSQNAILRGVDRQWKISELLDKLSEMTDVPADKMALLKGFPPKRIPYDVSNPVENLGLQHQDTIIVELDASGSPGAGVAANGTSEKPQSPANTASPSESPRVENPDPEAPSPAGNNGTDQDPVPPSAPETAGPSSVPDYQDLIPNEENSGLLLRHIVPSDNSCLFSSVTFCLSGGVPRVSDDGATFLREMIANTVAADPEKYSEAILGRPNKDYVEWIKKPESWGGGIELAILAEFYGMQISVVDTQSLHISCFGEDHNFSQRIFLIYDGIHYDPLYFEPFNGGATRTVFQVTETNMMELATQLAKEAKASNQYTDLKNFSLRCQICNTLIKGQTEAQAHAKKTGHTAFAEIIKK